MFKVINKREDYLKNPVLEMNEESLRAAEKNTINLFGKEFTMYSDEWKHHIHIKCTDYCDANCDFCIEKTERNNPQNKENVLKSTKMVLDQMNKQGHLRTVSITGGEPTAFPLFKELVHIVSSYPTTLFSVNTNGRFLNKVPENFTGFINISKHAIDDSTVFKRPFNITPLDIVKFKLTHPKAKVRFQCVLGVTEKMKSIKDVVKFIKHYGKYVDDFSFRNLIINEEEDKINDLFFSFREMLFKKGEFVEQVIQDYYVYETYNIFGTSITLSWSIMKELREYNESHSDNFLEEIIIHPDGTVCGSWNKKSLIIYKPEGSKNTFIPCRGEGCSHHCSRYIEETSCYSMSNCTSNPIPSC